MHTFQDEAKSRRKHLLEGGKPRTDRHSTSTSTIRKREQASASRENKVVTPGARLKKVLTLNTGFRRPV